MGNWGSLPPSETAFRTKLWRTIQLGIWQYFQHIQHFAAGQSNPLSHSLPTPAPGAQLYPEPIQISPDLDLRKPA